MTLKPIGIKGSLIHKGGRGGGEVSAAITPDRSSNTPPSENETSQHSYRRASVTSISNNEPHVSRC